MGSERKRVHREAAPATTNQSQSSSTASGGGLASTVNRALESGGSPLGGQTRNLMESRFGHDFSHVRVHTDTRAEESAQAVQARAYTIGSDIVFRSGEYNPGSQDGDKLIAHELTHVIQQGGTSQGMQAKLEVSQPGDPMEQEADAVAEQVVSRKEEVQGIGNSLQRKAIQREALEEEEEMM